MSKMYDEYLKDHIDNVRKGYLWLLEHQIIRDQDVPTLVRDIHEHDLSKYQEPEYSAYDAYFYGDKSYKVVQEFKYAWLHHIHANPHHWQYWVLQNDDKPEEVLEMPEVCAIEMICDWWSFSWKSGNLYEIFDWYEQHKGMKLHSRTRDFVEYILAKIKEGLASKTDA